MLIYDQSFHAVLLRQLTARERKMFEKSKKSKNTVNILHLVRHKPTK